MLDLGTFLKNINIKMSFGSNYKCFLWKNMKYHVRKILIDFEGIMLYIEFMSPCTRGSPKEMFIGNKFEQRCEPHPTRAVLIGSMFYITSRS